MTLPVSGTAERAWAELMASARSIDGTCRAGLPLLASGISSSYARQVYDFACGQTVVLTRVKDVAGLRSYGKLVTGNADYEVVPSIEATLAALGAVVNWIRTAWPVDADGRGVQFAFRPDSAGTEDLMFPPESLTSFAALVQTLLETLA